MKIARNPTITRARLLAASSLCACSALVPAWAETTAEGTHVPVETLVIEGVRTPITLAEMPTATTVIDREQLDLRQSFHVVDVLRDVPGVALSQSGPAGSQAQVRLRGAEGNHVLVLIDGIEVNDPASGDEFLFEHLSALEIDRIEVIRGPQSALWGSDAISGVINVVTRKPGEGYGASGLVEAGSQNTWRGAARASWGEDRWGLILGGSYSETDGSNISRIGTEDDGERLGTVQAGLELRPADGWTANLTARFVDGMNQSDPTSFVTGLPEDGDREAEYQRFLIGGTIKGDAGRYHHASGVSWFDSDNENFVDGLADTSTSAERWKVWHQSTFEVAEGHRVTLAIDYRETDFTQTGMAAPWGDPNYSASMTNTGLVVDYVGKLTDVATVTASVRYDDNSDFDNVTTWRLGGNMEVTDGLRLRGSYGRGQKAPTFGDRFGYTPNTFLGNPDLKPETSDSFEVGLDQMLQNGRAMFGLTYFNAKLEDEINGFSYDPVSTLYTAINKDGTSDRQGIEVTFDYALTAYWSLSSNYTWTDATEPDDMGGTRREVRRPEHKGAVSLTWRGENGATFDATATIVGEADDLDYSTFPASTVQLPEYALLSVAAEAPLTEQASIFGRLSLPTNSDYENVYGFAMPDMQVSAGVKLMF